ncbi:hypothetical protein ACTOVP_01385 [Arcanobacterium canis]
MRTFAKIWIRIPSFVATLVATFFISGIGDTYSLDVLFRYEAEFVPFYVLVFLVPVGFIPSFTSPSLEIEECFPVSPRFRYRLLLVLCMPLAAVLCLAAAVPLLGLSVGSLAIAARNVIGGLGIILVSRHFFSMEYSWILPVTYAGLCWVLGAPDYSQIAYPWALPLRDGSDVVAALSFCCVYVLGARFFVTGK